MKVSKAVFSDYIVDSISFIKSDFWRNEKLDNSDGQELTIDIDVSKNVKKTRATCTLTVSIALLDSSDATISQGTFTTLGKFRTNKKEPKLPIEKFASMNAYALMYPFIREHIASITLKAGMDPILIPSINFLALMDADRQAESLND